MKLKYYMRGLGIGIVLTTLILSISNPKEQLSDAEVIKRAEKLGMIVNDKENEELEMVLNKSKEASVTQEPVITITAAPVPTVKTAPTPVQEAALTPTVTPGTSTNELSLTEAPDDKNKKESTEIISFTVRKGMSSRQVAALLVEVGLAEDADDFNQAIMKAGKASIIRVGSYTIEKGAAYDEIIKLITSK